MIERGSTITKADILGVFEDFGAALEFIDHTSKGKDSIATPGGSATRIRSRYQLSTDSYQSYFNVIDEIYGTEIDYGQVHKVYKDRKTEKRYSPAKIMEVIIKRLLGNPLIKNISTSFLERQNLTIRMQLRRFTRLTNAFSKKLENLKAAVALHFYHYNFMRIHQTLRMTPAMEARLTNRIRGWDDLLNYSIY